MPVAPAATPAVAAPARSVTGSYPTIEQRVAELEKRSTQMVESALEILRGQAEELTRDSLEEFRLQVEAVLRDAELQLREGLQQSYQQSTDSLLSLRADLVEQIATRGKEVVRTSEETLRTRLRNLTGTHELPVPLKPPEPAPEK
jgi:exonuclease VII large subunit